jgi:N-acetylglutamate synthase-like GNAT family acetyltransferase
MVTIREASQTDEGVISALLECHELRPEGVFAPCTRYWVAEEDGLIIGAIGLELGRTSVLLRSAIVAPNLRGRGLGRELTKTALNSAQTEEKMRLVDGGARLQYRHSVGGPDATIDAREITFTV